MKRSRYTEERIIGILKGAGGRNTSCGAVQRARHERCEVLRLEEQTRGIEVSEAKRLRPLEAENSKLKRLLADAILDNAALNDLVGKNG